jgi:septal ring factor EnvC (AmiA/AmiB activator)
MMRFFSVTNFVGVLAVAWLCGIQWQTNSRLEAHVRELNQIRQDQSAKLGEQARSLKDDATDMEDLRQRLMMSESEATKLVQQRDELVEEKKQLIAAMEKWVAAVKQRDAALKQAAADIQTLVQQRNDAIAKFNDLANKYNNVVKEMQDEQVGH